MHANDMNARVTNDGNARSAALRLPARRHRLSSPKVKLSNLVKASECEQVAAVCYRVRSHIEFLLVRTRGGERWTFPKGSAEAGLTHAQAAAMEAFEEAGVHGRIDQTPFTKYKSRKRGESKRISGRKDFEVSAHLCEVLRLSKPKEANRGRTWFSADEAKERLKQSREYSHGSKLARVIDKAVRRIEELREVSHASDGAQADAPSTAHYADPLQKVQIEGAFSPAYRRAQFFSNTRRELGNASGQFSLRGIPARKLLRGEVLQFMPAEHESLNGSKKAKAPGVSRESR